MQVITIEQDDTELRHRTVQRAGEVLQRGGLVVFPTETVYGVAASAASIKGCDALRAIKGRPSAQPFTVHIPNPADVDRYVDLGQPTLKRLVHKVFPGPVTLIVEVAEEVVEAKLQGLGLPERIGAQFYHKHTVGLRCPDNPLARELLAAVDAPVIASSANRRGQPPPHDAQAALRAVGEKVELIVDGGRCRYAKSSTIVRVTAGTAGTPKVTVERSGIYDERFIHKLLRWTMLLVCSGNTCRSPMAEVIGRQILAEQRGTDCKDLESAGIRVLSAGTFAATGVPASPEAVAAVRKMGMDLTHHRSRSLAPELIHGADVIYCMTEGHRDAVLSMVPSVADKVQTLDPHGDVSDPMGLDEISYERCAELIHRCLGQRLKELQP